MMQYMTPARFVFVTDSNVVELGGEMAVVVVWRDWIGFVVDCTTRISSRITMRTTIFSLLQVYEPTNPNVDPSLLQLHYSRGLEEV
jgi:hypothetical protein